VGFIYIENFKFLSLKSKKLTNSCSSFSTVNFTDGCSSLNSLSVCSVFVLLGLDVIVYVPCAVYMFQLVLMTLGHLWLTHQFVCSTADQTESNFVSSLFVTN
jgi:hypothetical protein